MDIGCALHEYEAVEVWNLMNGLTAVTEEQWVYESQCRPSNGPRDTIQVITLCHDSPYYAIRKPVIEAKSGFLNVIQNVRHPLYAETNRLIQNQIAPNFPQCQVIRAQLFKLPPQQAIATHYDVGILAMSHRTCVPLLNSQDVVLTIGDEEFSLDQYMLYDMNNVKEHSIYNGAPKDFICLITDLLPRSSATCVYHDDEDQYQIAIGEIVH